MLSREEYDQVIQIFLVELNHLCLHATEKDLRELPRLNPEIDGHLEDLRDPNNDAGQALYNAFAYVDEYVGADWDRVASLGFEAYRIAQLRIAGREIDV